MANKAFNFITISIIGSGSPLKSTLGDFSRRGNQSEVSMLESVSWMKK